MPASELARRVTPGLAADRPGAVTASVARGIRLGVAGTDIQVRIWTFW